jgi:hypothetical protein
MRGCQCAGRQSTDWHFCFIGHVPWSILPSLICLIRYSLSITSDSVVSFGNTSANSNGRALVRQLMSLSLSTHRRATRLGVWILSVLSECSSQTFSFNRIGVVPLDRSATCSLTLDHLGTRHHLTAQSTATYGRRAMLSSCLGWVALRGPGDCQFAVHTFPGNGSRLTPNFRYGYVKFPD